MASKVKKLKEKVGKKFKQHACEFKNEAECEEEIEDEGLDFEKVEEEYFESEE